MDGVDGDVEGAGGVAGAAEGDFADAAEVEVGGDAVGGDGLAVEAAGVGGVADDAVGGDGDFLSGWVCGKLEGEDAVVEFGVAEVEPELSLLVGGVDGEADAEAEG